MPQSPFVKDRCRPPLRWASFCAIFDVFPDDEDIVKARGDIISSVPRTLVACVKATGAPDETDLNLGQEHQLLSLHRKIVQ